MMGTTLTTADLPESMSAPVEATPTPTMTLVLTCQHGPACPDCVLAAARSLIDNDPTLARGVSPAKR